MSPVDLLDRPLRALRVSVTDRCNFRCPHCMPRGGSADRTGFLGCDEILSFDEIFRLVGIFVGLGVTKVRLTGGEPLLRDDLIYLILKLKQLPGLQDVAITTNGSLLQAMAVPLKDAGLDRLTVSLNSLHPGRFQEGSDSGLPLDRVINSLEAARVAGFKCIKINCVLRRGINDMDIVPLATFAREKGYIVRFIEFMDVGTENCWSLESVVPAVEVASIICKQFPADRVWKKDSNCVSQHWRYKDGLGEFGLIASVTEPFCIDCDRARLSADGSLYTCLFASSSLNLNALIRGGMSTEDLSEVIRIHWRQRYDRYSEMRSEKTLNLPGAEMFHLGG